MAMLKKPQFLELFLMQEYPWAGELSEAMISGGLKAVKAYEHSKGKDKIFMLYCHVYMSYHSPVS